MGCGVRGLGCSLFLLFIGVCLTMSGCHGLEYSRRFRSPRQVSYAEFVKLHPAEGWFRITDCRLHFGDAAFKRTTISIHEAFIPVSDLATVDQPKHPVVLKTRDDGLLQLLEGILKLDELSDAASEKWIKEHRTQITLARTIEGMIEDKVDSKMRDLLAKSTTSGYVVIGGGRKPSVAIAAAELGIGLILVVSQALVWLALLRNLCSDDPSPAEPATTEEAT
jgi:hypothetical protein